MGSGRGKRRRAAPKKKKKDLKNQHLFGNWRRPSILGRQDGKAQRKVEGDEYQPLGEKKTRA